MRQLVAGSARKDAAVEFSSSAKLPKNWWKWLMPACPGITIGSTAATWPVAHSIRNEAPRAPLPPRLPPLPPFPPFPPLPPAPPPGPPRANGTLGWSAEADGVTGKAANRAAVISPAAIKRPEIRLFITALLIRHVQSECCVRRSCCGTQKRPFRCLHRSRTCSRLVLDGISFG